MTPSAPRKGWKGYGPRKKFNARLSLDNYRFLADLAEGPDFTMNQMLNIVLQTVRISDFGTNLLNHWGARDSSTSRPFHPSTNAVPAELRWQVWERDDFKCRKCGTRKHLSVDHIEPEAKGGPTTLDNLQTLCRSCNSSKGSL